MTNYLNGTWGRIVKEDDCNRKMQPCFKFWDDDCSCDKCVSRGSMARERIPENNIKRDHDEEYREVMGKEERLDIMARGLFFDFIIAVSKKFPGECIGDLTFAEVHDVIDEFMAERLKD